MRKHNWSVFLLSLLIAAMAMTSCHSKQGVSKSRYDRSRVTRHTGGDKRGGGSNRVVTISDEWSSLNIQLDENDNAELYKELKRWLGVPYRYGGNTMDGIDCSGLVCQVYKKVYGIKMQRKSSRQYERDCRWIDVDRLAEGDLVFFHTSKDDGLGITHVGIYLKENKFAHASSSRGVRISDLTEDYFIEHFVAAGRVEAIDR